MPGSICILCGKNLILDEEEICAHCELSNENVVAENGKYIETHNVNCGCCNVIVKEDSEGLYCDVCDRWFHNACCESPLIEELYSQLNTAPSNVKWFCDKCIWITEKWISSFPLLMKERGRTRRLNTAVNSFKTLLENDPEYDYTKEPEVKIEIQNEDIPYGFDETHSTDSEEYEVRKKIKKKKKTQKANIHDPNAKSYQCSFCEKTCTQQFLLNRHKRRVHKGLEPYKCSHCDAVFFTEIKLKIHDRTHTGNKPFPCSLCDKSFSREGWLEKHQIVHTRENPYECRGCKECFKEQDLLKEHRKSCALLVEKSCICSHCGQIFTGRKKLMIHERIHTGEKPYKCNQCDERFGDPYTHRKHKRTHPENKTHICSHCGKCFARNDHLKKHERIHTGEKPHQCSQCGKTFHRLDHLRKHEKYHIGEKPHVCTYCGKNFVRLDVLKTHEKIHTGEKPNEVSTGEKPHQCSTCEKSFHRLDHLKNHEKYHTGEKPFVCTYCGKDFVRQDNLKAHERIHTGEKPNKVSTGEKPHQCSTCGKRFHRLDHLRKHEKYHTGEKPYVCTYCGKEFVRQDNLKAHERIHTGEKPNKVSTFPRSNHISPESSASSQLFKTETSCDNSTHSDNYPITTPHFFPNPISGPSRTNLSSHNPTMPTSTTYNLPMSSSHPNRPIFNDPSNQMPEPIRLMFNQQMASLEGWSNDGRWGNPGIWGNYGQTKD